MNDEFLHSLRRPPPARFARELKRKLQAQETQTKRRLWSRRIRLLLLLVAGPALATGIYVLQRAPAESAPASPPPVPVIAEAAPLAAPSEPPVTTQPAPSQPEPIANSAPAQSRPALKIATSPLTDELIRSVLSNSRQRRLSDAAPRVDKTDAAAAFAGFCAREVTRRFDIVVTSRRMTREEFIACRDRGVGGIVESKIGYLALVFTSARDSMPIRVSTTDLYLAVGRQIIDPAEPGRLIDNPNITWDQVDSKLPYRPIKIFGPVRNAPLRTLLDSLLDPACKTRNIRPELCGPLRFDGLYTEVEQTALVIPQYLWSEPHALVLVDYEFYRENLSQLAGSALEGPEPSHATFADGTYPFARPIYLYTVLGRVAPAADGHDILRSLTSLQLSGPNRFGLVRPDEKDARERSRWNALNSESDLITNKE